MLLTVWTLGDEIWEKPQSGSTRDLKNGDLIAGQDQRTDLRTGSLCKSLILQSISHRFYLFIYCLRQN